MPTPEWEDKRGTAAGTKEALRRNAIKPGEVRNPKGMNGWKMAQSRIAAFMREVANPETGSQETRFERVLLATYTSALVPGPRGAPDRRLIVEQCAGKAKQQIEIEDSRDDKLDDLTPEQINHIIATGQLPDGVTDEQLLGGK